jgi:hypothetical protein
LHEAGIYASIGVVVDFQTAVDPRRRPPRVLLRVALLGPVVLGVGYVAISLVASLFFPNGSAFRIALSELFGSLLALLAIWSALGIGAWYVRVPASAGVALVWAALRNCIYFFFGLPWALALGWLLTLPAYFLLQQSVFWGLHAWRGYHFAHDAQPDDSRRAAQFTIRQLLGATLLVAISFGFYQVGAEVLESIDTETRDLRQQFLFWLATAAIWPIFFLLPLWMAYWLPSRRATRRLLYVLATCLTSIGSAWWWALQFREHSQVGVAGIAVIRIFCFALPLYAYFALLRRAGYRLVRPRQRRAVTAENGKPASAVATAETVVDKALVEGPFG